MADDFRTATPALTPLAAELARAPYAYDFFQAARRLECEHRDAPRWGRALRPADEPVRFGQDPSVAFAPAALASFTRAEAERPARLGVRFFGAFGANGPLPLHLTDYCKQRLHHHADATLARFVDLFHHRLLSLFYRAWAESRPTVCHDRPDEDRFMVFVASAFGLGAPALRDRDAFPDHAKLYFAGRLACQARNAEGLRAMLQDFFEVPAAIEQFVGQQAEIPDEYAWHLGVAPRRGMAPMGVLGQSATLGTLVWMRQQKFRIALGPLHIGDFRRFAPGGGSLPSLVAMVRNYAGDELDWDLRLMVEHQAVQPLVLGARSQLGWNSWLVGDGEQLRDWEDLIFEP
jgi:type VI secretion system protein ImpH